MKGTRRLVGAAGLVLACAGAATLGHASRPAPAAAAASGCVNPPAVFPESSVTTGLKATGKTVLQGTTPTSFGVKVMGILQDGIAPGIDMYVVKLSGPLVTRAGGAFEGISGSPVYVKGKLLGAVSYSLSYDRTVAGLTPAAPMVNLFGYPRAAAATTAAAKLAHPARMVPLTAALRRAVAAASHAPAATSGGMSLLKIPVGVSGLSDTGLQRLQKVFDRYGLPYTAFRGGSAPLPGAVSGPAIAAGGNFAATQSFGDLTFYGLGTTTAVCGDEAVAFGHPFNLTGPTSLGMNNANTIAIMNDPFTPYKLANITGFRGTVDQDRLTGIRGLTGVMPKLTAVTTALRNADLGTSRTGTTDIADQTMLALIGQYAVYVENVVAFDLEGPGSETMHWTITGRYHGDPFTLTRSGVAYSQYDIPYDAPYELQGELGALQSNKFGPVDVTGVRFSGTLTQKQLTETITKVESRTGLQPTWAARSTLHVRPGGTVQLRVTMTRPDGTTALVPMTLAVPAGFTGGTLDVRGGSPPQGCPYCGFGESFQTSAKTFAAMLAQFQNGERQNDLVAAVGATKTHVTGARVVRGRRQIMLIAG
jgi:hypothetical protein